MTEKHKTRNYIDIAHSLLTIATLVATSTESTSCPKIIILFCRIGACCVDGLLIGLTDPPEPLEKEFRWLEFAEPGKVRLLYNNEQ